MDLLPKHKNAFVPTRTTVFSKIMDWTTLAPDRIDAPAAKRLDTLAAAFRECNTRVNLVSRKDIENLEAHHIAPCAVAARFFVPAPGTRVIDVGTGGGLPGLPLAAIFPQVEFLLVDSIGKKIRAVAEMAKAAKLDNVRAVQARAENIPGRFDFATGRAVTALPVFISWIRNKMVFKGASNPENGLLYWKGGSLEPELAEGGLRPKTLYRLDELLPDSDYFSGKYIAHFTAIDIAKWRSNSPRKA